MMANICGGNKMKISLLGLVAVLGIAFLLHNSSYNEIYSTSNKYISEKNVPQHYPEVATHLLTLEHSIAKMLNTPWKKNMGNELLEKANRLNSLKQIFNVSGSTFIDSRTDRVHVMDACPEKYMGYYWAMETMFDRGWTLTKCKTNTTKFEDLLTIVLNFKYLPKNELKKISTKIFQGIAKSHPGIRVIVGLQQSSRKLLKVPKTIYATTYIVGKFSPGKAWNLLISKVKTKYVLIARNITHFYGIDASLMRLVNEAQVDSPMIVGGTTRNSTGHWKLGCHQMAFRSYEFRLKKGYDFSRHECVFCDVISGPFLSQTKYLRNHSFDETLDANMMFLDFFLRIKKLDIYPIVCADSMFYVENNEVAVGSWHPLANKHKITEIHLPDNVRISFKCKEIGLDCKKFIKSLVKPKCCLIELAHAINWIGEMFDKLNKTYNTDCGTSTGVVKFNGILPWDIDADLAYDKKDIKDLENEFKKQKFRYDVYEKGRYFVHTLGELFVETYHRDNLGGYFLKEQGLEPTKVQIFNHWVKGNRNPGRYVRNRYGIEIFKHAEHWSDTGGKDSGVAYQVGKFSKCLKPESSACLDQFFGDGNLQFLEPV